MTKQLNRFLRSVTPWVATGVLLQTTSCDLGSGELFQGLVGAILQNWVQQIVFGGFNLVP